MPNLAPGSFPSVVVIPAAHIPEQFRNLRLCQVGHAGNLVIRIPEDFDVDAAFRVLSIRIEKKVNYFSEVTVSD